jgi:N-methylhydantoinase A
MTTPRRIRIGIDTGGTFTDVVAFDEDSGELVTTKTPSTPSNPADGFLAGIDKVLGLIGADGSAIDAVSHGTTVATNQLLEGKVDRLGFVTTEGYEAMLEIARQSVPDGYGNSYFWVKPDRIVPRDRVLGVGGRLDFTGAEVRPFDEESARTAARWFRAQGVNTLGVCFLHAYANPEHEERMRAILAEEHPDAVVSLSSEVLPEYREYERAMTTLVDAAVKPRLSAYVNNIKSRLTGQYERSGDRNVPIPFYVMKSNGGVLSADEVVHQPITTVLSGPAAGALGAALIAKVAGFDRVLTSDGGGTSTDVSVVIDGEPTLTTEGSVGAFPSKIPMIDVVTVGAGGGSIAWLSPEGTLKVGPQSAGADPGPLCYGKGGPDGGAVTITDAHLYLGRIPPHLLGGEIPLDVQAAKDGVEQLASKLDLSPEACAAGILEISAWNQANALRQVTVKRGLDVRDFTLTTFGGSGSLLLCRLMDVLGIPTVLVPPNPGNVSAFGLLTVDVKNDYVRTHVSLADNLDPASVTGVYDALSTQAAAALTKEGFADDQHSFARTADLRYFGQAFEVRVPVPEGSIDPGVLDEVAARFHAEHKALYGYDFSGDDSQQVEWVNLRVSGVGPILRPEIKRVEADGFETGASAPSSTTDRSLVEEVVHGFETGASAPSSTTDRSLVEEVAQQPSRNQRPVCFDAAEGYVETPILSRPDLPPGATVQGPAIIEEFGSTVPLHPGFTARVDEYLNIIVTRSEA